jgi:hypothetical protein
MARKKQAAPQRDARRQQQGTSSFHYDAYDAEEERQGSVQGPPRKRRKKAPQACTAVTVQPSKAHQDSLVELVFACQRALDPEGALLLSLLDGPAGGAGGQAACYVAIASPSSPQQAQEAAGQLQGQEQRVALLQAPCQDAALQLLGLLKSGHLCARLAPLGGAAAEAPGAGTSPVSYVSTADDEAQEALRRLTSVDVLLLPTPATSSRGSPARPGDDPGGPLQPARHHSLLLSSLLSGGSPAPSLAAAAEQLQRAGFTCYTLRLGLGQPVFKEQPAFAEDYRRKLWQERLLGLARWLLPHWPAGGGGADGGAGAGGESLGGGQQAAAEAGAAAAAAAREEPPEAAEAPAFDAAELYAAVKPSGREPELRAAPPSLRPSLRPYQRRAVAWMLAREGCSSGPAAAADPAAAAGPAAGDAGGGAEGGRQALHPLWRRVRALEGAEGPPLYLNLHTGWPCRAAFSAPEPVSGGILVGPCPGLLLPLLLASWPAFHPFPALPSPSPPPSPC